MKLLILFAFFSGLVAFALSWLWHGAPIHMFEAGLFLLLASYLFLLIALYRKKVNVYSRGGVVIFSDTPWAYRFYFFLLFLFWLIPNIILLSKVAASQSAT
jgi:hypothetical protein